MSRYFSGNEARVRFNSILVDDVSSIQWTSSQEKKPIFGFESQTWDRVAPGQFYVQGSFTLSYSRPGILSNPLRNRVKTSPLEPTVMRPDLHDQLDGRGINLDKLEIMVSYGAGERYFTEILRDVHILSHGKRLVPDGKSVEEKYDFVARNVGTMPYTVFGSKIVQDESLPVKGGDPSALSTDTLDPEEDPIEPTMNPARRIQWIEVELSSGSMFREAVIRRYSTADDDTIFDIDKNRATIEWNQFGDIPRHVLIKGNFLNNRNPVSRFLDEESDNYRFINTELEKGRNSNWTVEVRAKTFEGSTLRLCLYRFNSYVVHSQDAEYRFFKPNGARGIDLITR